MLEQMDTDVVQPEKDHDMDLVPKDQEVNPPTSPDPGVEQVLSDQGDTEILEDNS